MCTELQRAERRRPPTPTSTPYHSIPAPRQANSVGGTRRPKVRGHPRHRRVGPAPAQPHCRPSRPGSRCSRALSVSRAVSRPVTSKEPCGALRASRCPPLSRLPVFSCPFTAASCSQQEWGWDSYTKNNTAGPRKAAEPPSCQHLRPSACLWKARGHERGMGSPALMPKVLALCT